MFSFDRIGKKIAEKFTDLVVLSGDDDEMSGHHLVSAASNDNLEKVKEILDLNTKEVKVRSRV